MQEMSVVKKLVGLQLNSPFSPPNRHALPSAAYVRPKSLIGLTPVMEELRDMSLSSAKMGSEAVGVESVVPNTENMSKEEVVKDLTGVFDQLNPGVIGGK
jgi:hypothetical protein